jgi:RES domain-containing protein
MDAYRVSSCRYINDLSGTGAGTYGGRWNSKGTYVLYASLTPSLALLENIVHMASIPIEDYCLAKYMVPDDKIKTIKITDLPSDWSSYPSPLHLKIVGDQFVLDNIFLAIKLPSVIMPEENNILINPRHPDFKRIKNESTRRIPIDVRLF